jgi:hypothetical protein
MADNFNNNKRISALSLVGRDRYDQYVQELSSQGTIAGKQLSPSERKEAFKRRNNKVQFRTFVERVLQKKAVATAKVKPIRIRVLPGTAERERGGALAKFVPQPEAQKPSLGILRILNSILDNLKKQFKFDKKKEDDDRKEEEREKRSKRESALEGVKKVGKGIVDKVVAPFKSIFDRIWNFIFYTLLGRAFTQLMNWLGDPKNAQKVQVLGRFLKDWWPALLGLYFNPFKGFMLNTLKSIAGFAARFALLNPLGLGASVALGGEYLRRKADPIKQKITKEYAEKEAKRTGKTPEQIKEELKKIDERSQFLRSLGNVNVNPYEYASGGFVSSKTGVRITGAGVDTQLTALQPGEVVMNRAAVSAVGAKNLLALNSKYGGSSANQPKYANNIRLMRGGGLSFGGVQAGFTGMAKAGFEAIMGGDIFRLGKFKPQILGRGAYSAPTMKGAQRYAGAQGSLGGRQVPGGVVKSIVPGGAPRINFLEPQAKVKPAMFDKGKLLADKLLRGEYSRSALANQLRAQLGSGVASPVGARPGRGFGAISGGIELGALLAPLAVGLAKQRRSAQRERYTSLMLGKTDVSGKTASIVPTPRPKSSFINLPPITQSTGTPTMGSNAGTHVPSFPAVSASGGSDRSTNASIYGII